MFSYYETNQKKFDQAADDVLKELKLDELLPMDKEKSEKLKKDISDMIKSITVKGKKNDK